ncbi:carboxymuconolactone decarboxylase [Mycolicibacterium porcinum]|nr:carboxymuconolactone decarboxylase family protein [Mycolicibacterium porcinum]OCB14577.1 carboxymuconolactone decarboxylase [Mycolicibacterium porcinum]
MTIFQPLPVAEWPQEMHTAMAAMSPPNPRHPRPKHHGRPKALNILGVLAHHPALAQAFFTFNGHNLRTTTLSERERELLVLRTAAVRQSSYEWAQHVVMAHDVGIDNDELSWIAWGPDAPAWSTHESALLRAVDELIESGAIQPETLAVLSESFGIQQILDVVFTVGAYETLGWMLKSLGVELDDDIRSWLNHPPEANPR